jgi:hypothetical protein
VYLYFLTNLSTHVLFVTTKQWYQANPHCFHLLTLGTLHSLPSPVPRRSQKVYKSDYFEYLKKEKDARDAVSDTRYWMMRHKGLESAESLSMVRAEQLFFSITWCEIE